MKLATLKTNRRDGLLLIVKRDLSAWTRADAIVPTMQAALDDWGIVEPQLRTLAEDLEMGRVQAEAFDVEKLLAPLPRAYEWVDGSAYINHILLVRKARKSPPPLNLETDPLVYQGGSGDFLAPTQDIVIRDESWGCDFESEVAVVLGDVPMGTSQSEAAQYVRLLLVANDVSLRNLIPEELAKGFGFFQSKPATTFAPVACTPDELAADAWKGGRVYLKLNTWLNGKLIGDTHAGPEMHFSFFDLVQHLAKTRNYSAGTILGSGTVSNADRNRGVSCLAERRMIETIDASAPKTPFLSHGDQIEIEMHHPDGTSLFGRICQRVCVVP